MLEISINRPITTIVLTEFDLIHLFFNGDRSSEDVGDDRHDDEDLEGLGDQYALEESREPRYKPLRTALVTILEAVQHDEIRTHQRYADSQDPDHIQKLPWQPARQQLTIGN